MLALRKIASGPGHLELQEVPEPHPGPGQVLLAVQGAGICGTDLHIRDGEFPCYPPVTLGHEFCGIIAGLGQGVTGWSVGDRVTSLAYATYCGKCEFCLQGEMGQCKDRRSYGSGFDGGFAQQIVVNASGLLRLPQNQDFIAGALTEPLACVTKAVFEIGQLQAGERVVVLGPGAIGLLTVQAARAAGAEVVLVGLRNDAARLELGRSLGAADIRFAEELEQEGAVIPYGDRGGADVILECAGAASAFRTGLALVRRKGRIIQVGLFGKPVPADLDRIVFKDLVVRGTFASSRSSWQKAIELLANGQVDTRKLVSDVYPLQQWEDAFSRASNRSGLKVVFRP